VAPFQIGWRDHSLKFTAATSSLFSALARPNVFPASLIIITVCEQPGGSRQTIRWLMALLEECWIRTASSVSASRCAWGAPPAFSST